MNGHFQFGSFKINREDLSDVQDLFFQNEERGLRQTIRIHFAGFGLGRWLGFGECIDGDIQSSQWRGGIRLERFQDDGRGEGQFGKAALLAVESDLIGWYLRMSFHGVGQAVDGD